MNNNNKLLVEISAILLLGIICGYAASNDEVAAPHDSPPLVDEFTWTKLRYQCNAREEQFVQSKRDGDLYLYDVAANTSSVYIYQNNIPMGANPWGNKLFVTVPKRHPGIPYTLNYVPLDCKNKHNAPLIPYPSCLHNDLNAKDDDVSKHFVSVYRVEVDRCDRLWFVDTGMDESPEAPKQLKAPELVVIDLRSDRILQRRDIPKEYVTLPRAFVSVTVDVDPDTCRNTYAYMPDFRTPQLVVYGWEEDRFWRFKHDSFQVEPTNNNFHIGGQHFQWNDGVFSVALTAPDQFGHRDAYYHAMSANNLYKVSNRILRNERLANDGDYSSYFRWVGNKGPDSQSSMSAIHGYLGVLFMTVPNRFGVACWRLDSTMTDLTVFQSDPEKFLYGSDLKVHDDKLYVMTNSIPVYEYSVLNYTEVNFRVWTGNVHDAVEGTPCLYPHN